MHYALKSHFQELSQRVEQPVNLSSWCACIGGHGYVAALQLLTMLTYMCTTIGNGRQCPIPSSGSFI